MKRIRKDSRAEEQLLGPFVFIGLLLIMSGLLMTSASNIVASNKYAQFDYDTGYAIIGGTEYNYLDPTSGYSITQDNVTDNFDDDNPLNLLYDGDTLSVDDLRVGIVRDNEMYNYDPGRSSDFFVNKNEFLYVDYIMVYMTYGIWSHDSVAIPLQGIIDAQSPETNISFYDFYLHNENYTLVINTPGTPDDHAGFIENNIYTMYVGCPLFSPDLAKVSMWKLIGMIATGNLPETQPVVDVILAAMFWLTAGFMIAMILSRFIPLIAGG